MDRGAEYEAWRAANKRCRDEKNPRYGGRGVSVCTRWLTFENFLEDMGPRPSVDHSLDRIDNEGNYDCGKCPNCLRRGVTKTNCRWGTRAEQNANKSNNRWIEAFGKRQHLAAWARETGVSPECLTMRMDRLGWSSEKALSATINRKAEFGERVRAAGYKSVTAFIKAIGSNPATVYKFANNDPTLSNESRYQIESALAP